MDERRIEKKSKAVKQKNTKNPTFLGANNHPKSLFALFL